ncbi:MAG: YceI family protein [Geminicoccaceae bacterium]
MHLMPVARLAAFGLAVLPVAAHAEPARYDVDPEHASVAFEVTHLDYYTQVGMFTDVAGGFTFDPETQSLSDLEVVIQTESVFTGLEKRDEHLRSADFLNIGEFPEMTFTMTDAQAVSETEGTVTGDLTLLGVTKPVTLNVTLNKVAVYPFGHGKETVGIDATTTITRSEFGMSYFAQPGGVGDQIPIQIGLEAIIAE